MTTVYNDLQFLIPHTSADFILVGVFHHVVGLIVISLANYVVPIKAKDKDMILIYNQDVTFKDLKKRVNLQTIQHQSNRFEICKGKPFWIWDVKEHKQADIKTKGDCCFNHIVGLPIKGRIEKPLFDYEKILYYSLLDNDYSNILRHTFKHKYLWVKSTGYTLSIYAIP